MLEPGNRVTIHYEEANGIGLRASPMWTVVDCQDGLLKVTRPGAKTTVFNLRSRFVLKVEIEQE